MVRTTSLRRGLLAGAFAAVFALLSLAPAEAIAVRRDRPSVVRPWELRDLLGRLRSAMRSLWGEEGSSMDPLGD